MRNIPAFSKGDFSLQLFIVPPFSQGGLGGIKNDAAIGKYFWQTR